MRIPNVRGIGLPATERPKFAPRRKGSPAGDRGCRLYARQRFDSLHSFVVVARYRCGGVVTRAGEIDFDRDHMAGIESGIGIQHVPERLDEQCGAGQQNQAHRYFTDHKRCAKASLLSSAAHAGRSFTEFFVNFAERCTEGRNQAK